VRVINAGGGVPPTAPDDATTEVLETDCARSVDVAEDVVVRDGEVTADEDDDGVELGEVEDRVGSGAAVDGVVDSDDNSGVEDADELAV